MSIASVLAICEHPVLECHSFGVVLPDRIGACSESHRTMRKCSLALTVAIAVAWALPIVAWKRVGNHRFCDITDEGLGCKCNKTSDCRDYTRDRAGFCDIQRGTCVHCLYGQHFEGNFSASFFSEAFHRCVRGDSCEEIVNERGDLTEVECIGGLCIREMQETEERCSCRDGYRYQKMWDGRFRCADANECEDRGKQECAPRHCINTEGSFECGCRPGYRLVNSGASHEYCEEIDECLEVIGICPQGCRNVPGTFNCTCHMGYMPTYEDGRMHCNDIDECQVNHSRYFALNAECQERCFRRKMIHLKTTLFQLDVCHPMTTCYNTIGSYYCTTPVQAPQSFSGWAMTLIPMFVCIVILALCCRNRTLEQEILRMSSEDLAEKGRYEVSAISEKLDAEA